MIRKMTVISTVLLMAFNFAFGQYQQHNPGVGNVNWSDQIVRATGIGAPNPNMPKGAQRAGAITAAKTDAFRNLLSMVKGMYLTSETTVENAMVSSDVITTEVQGVVRNYRIVDTRYMSSGDVEVDVEVPLSSFYELLDELPGAFQGAPGGGFGAGGITPSNSVYTGLIINASGLGVRPALAPKILDESGQEVYGTGYVSREYAIQVGVVGYDKDLNRARSNERVAGNPAVVKALRAEGTNKTDLVISNGDAQIIRAAAANQNFLEQCKVMVILD